MKIEANNNLGDTKPRLVGAETLRGYFEPKPSLRTVRSWQKKKIIPFCKLAGRVYFDPSAVLEHIKSRATIRGAA